MIILGKEVYSEVHLYGKLIASTGEGVAVARVAADRDRSVCAIYPLNSTTACLEQSTAACRTILWRKFSSPNGESLWLTAMLSSGAYGVPTMRARCLSLDSLNLGSPLSIVLVSP
eukprot:gene10747-biopygen3521